MGEIVDISTKSLLELLEPPAPSVEETGEVLDAASSLLDISSTDGRRLWQTLFDEEMPEVRPPEEEKTDHMARKIEIRKARNKQHAYNHRRRNAEKMRRLMSENESLRRELELLRKQLESDKKTVND